MPHGCGFLLPIQLPVVWSFILPAMRSTVIFAFLFFAVVFSSISAQTAEQAKPPSAEDARAFIDKVNSETFKLAGEASRAEWTTETDITDDTEATTALINEQVTARGLELVEESHRWDKVTLPPELRREMLLLQLNAPAAPKEPKLLAEETQLAAQLTGMYGKGKYCPGTPAGQEPAADAKCMGIDEISDIMAHSHDPEELTKLWVGWHAIGTPMREKYARFIELENIGAKELGYQDTGELWRAGYDMTPAQFSAELERAWTQLEPLYRELHAYVRSRLIAKYGKAAERQDGMIPSQLLGNMWAQEWGNIYDIVAPTDPKLSQYKPVDLEAALKKQIAEKDPAAAAAFVTGADLSVGRRPCGAARRRPGYGPLRRELLQVPGICPAARRRSGSGRSLCIRAIAKSFVMHPHGTWMLSMICA